MPTRRIPTIGQDDGIWGQVLNDHLKQVSNPTTGGINLSTDSTNRPTTLTLDDEGYSLVNASTGNFHRWNGSNWDVQQSSQTNVLDFGLKGDGIVDESPALGLLISTLTTRFSTTGRQQTLYFPNGVYNISLSIELKQGISIRLEDGAIIRAHSTWVNTNVIGAITMDSLVVTDTNTTKYVEHQFVVGKGFLDCASLANNAIKIIRARKCTFADFHILRPLKEGINCIDNGVSTSYECRLQRLNLSMMSFNSSGQEINTVNNADNIGISLNRCTDFHVSDIIIMGFRIGTKTFNGAGANFFYLVHVWNRPQNGLLTHCFWIEGQTEFYTQCYADSPTQTIGTDSYGFYVNNTSINLDGCIVYGNDSISGGLPYGNDNQIVGIFAGPAGNNGGTSIIKNCRFIGSPSARIKQDMLNVNASFILGNFSSTTVIVQFGNVNRVRTGYLFKTSGSGSFELAVNTQGASFNGVQSDWDSYPQNNNTSTFDGIVNWFRRTGTSGLVQFNLWKGDATSGTSPSTLIVHSFRKSLSWVANKFGTDPDIGGIVFGLDSNTTRGTGALAEFRGKTVFSGVTALPSYTVTSLPNAAAGAIDGSIAWASNGRKPAEGAGAGTGVMVVYNNATTSWLRTTDYTLVSV